ncbi:MAG: hypothetical protein CIT01_04935 [Methanobacterium sp. BRmetb2]|jgi:hypothetical protein|nr:MAG: hypothetical protein CIT01_04935 [Methanobacterium sp. BRmetb2]
MGDLLKTLKEFEDISSEFHEKIMNILKENYCWKCPMRTTSSKTFCREVDAWIRLTHALEDAVKENMEEKLSPEARNFVQMKYLNKISKNQFSYDRKLLIKLKADLKPYAPKGSVLIIEENCEIIKKDDLVLIPKICLLHVYGFSRIKYNDKLPFKMAKVSKIFHESGGKFIKTHEGIQISPQLLIGRVMKILDKKNSKFL